MTMKRRIMILSALLAIGLPIFAGDESELDAQKPEGAICVPGGPCLLPSAAEKETKASDPGEPLPPNRSGVESEERVVDLEKEPWLVESVNLPANHPTFKRDKIVFADSLLWTALPDVVPEVEVEKWLTPLPDDRAGKYLLIEVWATWCPPCRRSLNYLNYLAEHYRDDLTVVAICEMEEEKVRAMPGDHDIDHVKFALAVDTGRRFANALHVTGIPHVVLIEPSVGGVVWEGMPTLPGHELDGKTLDKFFAIGKKLRDAGRFPKEPVIQFTVSPATDEQRATRHKHESDSEDKAGEPSRD